MTRILYRSQNGKCDLILFWTLLLKRCLCTIVYTNELDLDTINNYRSHLHTPLCVYWVTFTHSEFALLCMGVELLCQYEAMYLHDRFRCCTKVFPQMFVGCIDRFMRTVKWAKFGDMLFFHSWKRVHVHSFNCFQMCALASQPLSLPFSFAFISHRPLPRSELSSTSCVSSALGTNRVCLSHYINDMVRNSFVCLDIAKLTLDPKIADHCGLLRVVICLAEMKFHCKTAYSSLANTHTLAFPINLSQCLWHVTHFNGCVVPFHRHSLHTPSLLCSPVALVALQDLTADTDTHMVLITSKD